MEGEVLQVKGIRVRYSGIPVIQGISFDVGKKEATCVVGANGAGKSTLLRLIAQELEPDGGNIYRRPRLTWARLEQGS